MLTQKLVDTAVRRALHEDAPWGDLTVQLTVPGHTKLDAQVRAREPGIFAGGALLAAAFTQLDASIVVRDLAEEGQRVHAGESLARVTGAAASILTAERVALNFVQRLSGIATLTAAYVDRVRHTGARIADTRKTTPGLRAFEKHAVRVGGGSNHRFSLSDAVMMKDNHLAALGATQGQAITEALRGLRHRVGHTTAIIVEIDRLSQLEPVLAADVTGVLFDNFSIDQLRQGVRQTSGRAICEASGGVTLANVRQIAETGVEVISVGKLTHSAAALDVGLDVIEP